MSKKVPLNCVYVVVCYGNIIGIYANTDDAHQAQMDLINKNRPADVLCRTIIYPQNFIENGQD